MIRNIIFDLGNVLLSWRPDQFFLKENYPEQKIKVLLNDIINSDTWKQLDNGDITISEAIDIITLKSTLKRDEIALVFSNCIEILYPIKNNVRLLPLLKKRGYQLYYLSNFPAELFKEVLGLYDFFKYFDGGVISSHVLLSKPDFRIYQTLLDKYGLKTEESLFIDDLINNVNAAKALSIKAIHLEKSEKLTEEIENIIGTDNVL